MFYETRITTPANTPQDEAKETIIKVQSGIIHRIEVQIPPGARGLSHAQIYYHEHQIFPSNLEGFFTGDNTSISFKDHFKINTLPLQLKILTWNDDDTFQHDIIIRIGILPESVLLPGLQKTAAPPSLARTIQNILGNG